MDVAPRRPGARAALAGPRHDAVLPARRARRLLPDIDEQIARLTLESSGARIDVLTDAQRDYLNSWRAAP